MVKYTRRQVAIMAYIMGQLEVNRLTANPTIRKEARANVAHWQEVYRQDYGQVKYDNLFGVFTQPQRYLMELD